MENNLIYGALVLTPALVFAAIIWGYQIKVRQGDERLKAICHTLQVLCFVFVILVIGSVAILLTGQRDGFVGFMLMTITLVISYWLGTMLGKKVFVQIVKNKIGQFKAEQICGNEKF